MPRRKKRPPQTQATEKKMPAEETSMATQGLKQPPAQPLVGVGKANTTQQWQNERASADGNSPKKTSCLSSVDNSAVSNKPIWPCLIQLIEKRIKQTIKTADPNFSQWQIFLTALKKIAMPKQDEKPPEAGHKQRNSSGEDSPVLSVPVPQLLGNISSVSTNRMEARILEQFAGIDFSKKKHATSSLLTRFVLTPQLDYADNFKPYLQRLLYVARWWQKHQVCRFLPNSFIVLTECLVHHVNRAQKPLADKKAAQSKNAMIANVYQEYFNLCTHLIHQRSKSNTDSHQSDEKMPHALVRLYANASSDRVLAGFIATLKRALVSKIENLTGIDPLSSFGIGRRSSQLNTIKDVIDKKAQQTTTNDKERLFFSTLIDCIVEQSDLKPEDKREFREGIQQTPHSENPNFNQIKQAVNERINTLVTTKNIETSTLEQLKQCVQLATTWVTDEQLEHSVIKNNLLITMLVHCLGYVFKRSLHQESSALAVKKLQTINDVIRLIERLAYFTSNEAMSTDECDDMFLQLEQMYLLEMCTRNERISCQHLHTWTGGQTAAVLQVRIADIEAQRMSSAQQNAQIKPRQLIR